VGVVVVSSEENGDACWDVYTSGTDRLVLDPQATDLERELADRRAELANGYPGLA
jgi:hypothetical protein